MREVNFKNVDLNLLRVFDAVYRERNLTRAGQYLCLTQPAMSHALARLRTLFGDELFLRTPRGMEPTPGAMQIAGPISEAIGAVHRLLQGTTRFDPLAVRMTFRIGVTDHTSAVVLPSLLERLRVHAPGIDIQASHVNVESAREQLDEGALHLAVVGSGDHPPRFDVRHLLREPLVCMGAHDHPGLEQPLTLQRFAALDHIVVSPSASHRSLIDQLLASHNLTRRTVLSIPFLTAVPQLVAQARLVCVVPRNLAERLEPYGSFRWLPVPLEGAYFDFFALWHSRETVTASHAWLRSQVLGTAGQG